MNLGPDIPPLLAKPVVKPSSVRRLLGRFGVFTAVVIGILLMVLICFQVTRKDTVGDYVFLCTGLLENLPVAGTTTLKASDAEIQARIQRALDTLDRIAWRGKNLAPVSRNYYNLIRQAEGMQQNAPKLSPIIFGSAEAALGLYAGQRGVVNEGGHKALKGTENLWDAFIALQKLYAERHVLAIQLADMAPQFSGPVTNAEVLRCLFAEHTPGFLELQTKDLLALTNSSGQELHNCVVAVRLSDSAGNSCLNLYFVPDWKIGEKRAVIYSSNDFPEDTVADIVRVDVAEWSKEFSMQPLILKKPVMGWPDLK